MFTEPRSLGWRTDLIFARFDGKVAPRSDHLVIRTPPNPTFWWGNSLLFDHAPRSVTMCHERTLGPGQIPFHNCSM